MEWFAFLIYILIAACCAMIVWFTIKMGFRVSTPPESAFPELMRISATDAVPTEQTQRLFWNFTSTLIVIPTILLVLGIAVRNLPLQNPVTYTLGGSLLLIWCMALCSGMLASREQLPVDKPASPDILEQTVSELKPTSQLPTTPKESL